MKTLINLKFVLIGFVGFIGAEAYGVTLPTTSYTPFDDPYSTSQGTVSMNGVAIVGQSYSPISAGEGSAWGDACVAAHASSMDIAGCQNCCADKAFGSSSELCPNYDCSKQEYDEYMAMVHECHNACGRSLPIEDGSFFLILMAVCGGFLKKVKKEGAYNLFLHIL